MLRPLLFPVTMLSVGGLLLTPAWTLAQMQPGSSGAIRSNSPFPPSYYGFSPGYYGPYYPGQYQYGGVQPDVYRNYGYPRASGYQPTSPYIYNTRDYPPPTYSYQPPPSSSSRFGPYSSGSSVPEYDYPLDRYLPPAVRAPARQDTSAQIEVRLPTPTSELWVEGRKTTTTGDRRPFRSPPLTPGVRYIYEFIARWYEDGREVTRFQSVPVRAGERLVVDFVNPN